MAGCCPTCPAPHACDLGYGQGVTGWQRSKNGENDLTLAAADAVTSRTAAMAGSCSEI